MKTPWSPNPDSARSQIGRARNDSDRQWEFWRTFQQAQISADQRAQRNWNDRHCQTTLAGAAYVREHTRQMVMQGTALIVRISTAMLMLSTIVVCVMMVHMIGAAGVGNVGGNILLVFESVLEVNADQRHDTGSLGYKK